MAVGSLVVFLHAQLGFQVVSDGHPHLQRNLKKNNESNSISIGLELIDIRVVTH